MLTCHNLFLSKSPFSAKASAIQLKIVWELIRKLSMRTGNRHSVLRSIIRASLGLAPCADDYLQYPTLWERMCGVGTAVKRSAILDAEMVCYSESKCDIDGGCWFDSDF